jgi:hypothetical protein
MTLYWRIFNFLVRRVVAVGFVVVGSMIGLMNLPNLFFGGTINVDGAPSDDIVFRLVVVLLPFLVSILGIALYRIAPFSPDNNFPR